MYYKLPNILAGEWFLCFKDLSMVVFKLSEEL